MKGFSVVATNAAIITVKTLLSKPQPLNVYESMSLLHLLQSECRQCPQSITCLVTTARFNAQCFIAGL